MTFLKNLKLSRQLALLALALCFSAGLGKAQTVLIGKFTLPVDAHWGKAVLPAGDYTFTLRSGSDQYVLYVRGEAKSAIILSFATDTLGVSDHGALTLVDAGGQQYIRTFEAGPLGLRFNYLLPKRATMENTAQAQLTVPVFAGGK